jgi:hypothetical protein
MELNEPFLSTIAQVSATIIGFALLTPVVQAMSSRMFRKGEEAIHPKTLLIRSLEVACLPIIVLFWPLLGSLLLISQGLELLESHYYIGLSIVFPAIAALCFLYAKKYSDMRTKYWLLEVLLEWIPFSLILFCIGIYISIHIDCSLRMYFQGTLPFYLATSLLVVSGLLLCIRNLAVSYETGLRFKTQDISAELKRAVTIFKEEIEEAINSRKAAVEKLEQQVKQQRMSKMKSLEFHRSIARHEFDISRWQEILNEVIKYEKIFNTKDLAITLRECIDYQRWEEEWSRHLKEFEQGTYVIERSIKRTEESA